MSGRHPISELTKEWSAEKLAAVEQRKMELKGFPIVGWGSNYSGVCAECGNLIKAYDSNFQTADKSKVYHVDCVRTDSYRAKYPNLLYYSDG